MRYDEPPADSPVIAALADATRRGVLAVLDETDRGLAIRELARSVSARETTHDPASIPSAQFRRTVRSLRHVDLPKLSAAGLVTAGEVVELADDPVVTHTAAWSADTAADPAVDEEVRALADGRRRTTLTILRRVDEPLQLTGLAERVASATDQASSTDRVVAALDHVHLPKLDDVGMVAYERGRGIVAYEGLPRSCERLLSAVSTGEDDTGTSDFGDSILGFPLA